RRRRSSRGRGSGTASTGRSARTSGRAAVGDRDGVRQRPKLRDRLRRRLGLRGGPESGRPAARRHLGGAGRPAGPARLADRQPRHGRGRRLDDGRRLALAAGPRGRRSRRRHGERRRGGAERRVPAGATSGSAPYTVPADTATGDVTLTGQLAGSKATATLDVTPNAPTMAAFNINPSSMSSNQQVNLDFDVTLKAPAPQ